MFTATSLLCPAKLSYSLSTSLSKDLSLYPGGTEVSVTLRVLGVHDSAGRQRTQTERQRAKAFVHLWHPHSHFSLPRLLSVHNTVGFKVFFF